ncbi:MAG: phage tail tape measure protein [Clostridiales bacterium]|nr:phage tail tape measure protein [Clostridiales bacterium]
MARDTELKIKISGKVDPSLKAACDKTTASLQRSYNKMKNTTKIAATAIAGAGAMALKKSIDIGSEFEAQMSTVGAIANASESDMVRLTEKAKEMGATTKFTATQSGQAFEYMAMAGWKTSQMLNGISGIMSLAAASGEELGTTSDIVTDALTAFNLKAKDSGHFSDVLAQTSASANTNVSMLGESFKYVAPVAGSMGYSVEDISLALGLMANASVKGSIAGRSLKTAIANMAAPTDKMEAAMKKYNISLKDSHGNVKDFKSVLDNVRDSLGQLTDKKERAAAIKTIFGKDALAGMSAIITASKKDYDSLTESIYNCDGAAEKMANRKMDNLKGDMDLLTSALETKAINIYELTSGPLREVTQNLTDWVEEFDVNSAAQKLGDFGGAVMDAAEPLLDVGEWLLDHPDVAVDAIGGVAGTLVASNIAGHISNITSSVKALNIALKANPVLFGGIAVAGTLTAIGIAVYQAGEQAKEASLEDHFGNIAFSMDELNDAADRIIGTDKLQEVSELLSSTRVSDGFLKQMQKAASEVKKMDWKVSAGLKISNEDISDYKSNVETYVKSAQDYINNQGYTVNIATNLLYDDGDTKNKLIKDNNSFYNGLDQEAKKLSDKISKRLKKAVKDGMTPDLQEEVNGLLQQLSDITNTISQAESDAKWDTLSAEFSGKNMTADSFDKMQSAINTNIDEIKEGAQEALETANTNTNAKYLRGKITEEEMKKEKESNAEAYNKTISDAKNKGAEFMYNSLMDTYGRDIKYGNYADGNAKAIQQIIDKMAPTVEGTDYESIINTIKSATLSGDMVRGTLLTLGNIGRTDNNTGYTDKIEQDAESAKKIADNYFSEVGNSSKKSGEAAVKTMKDVIKNGLVSGVNANMPISITGNYAVTSSGSTASSSSGTTTKKSAADELNSPDLAKKFGVPGHATGTISTKEHLAMVSEKNKAEAIIPLDGSKRSKSLYYETGRILGMEKGGSVTHFSPQIHITLSGSASESDAEKIRKIVEKQVESSYQKMIKKNKRLNMRG